MLVCKCAVARSSATDSHSRPHYWINLVPAVRSSLYHSPAIGGGAVTGLIVILNTLTYNAQLSLPPISVAELEFYNWKCFLCKHRVGWCILWNGWCTLGWCIFGRCTVRRLMHIACELDRIATCFLALVLVLGVGIKPDSKKKPSIGSFGPTTWGLFSGMK